MPRLQLTFVKQLRCCIAHYRGVYSVEPGICGDDHVYSAPLRRNPRFLEFALFAFRNFKMRKYAGADFQLIFSEDLQPYGLCPSVVCLLLWVSKADDISPKVVLEDACFAIVGPDVVDTNFRSTQFSVNKNLWDQVATKAWIRAVFKERASRIFVILFQK